VNYEIVSLVFWKIKKFVEGRCSFLWSFRYDNLFNVCLNRHTTLSCCCILTYWGDKSRGLLLNQWRFSCGWLNLLKETAEILITPFQNIIVCLPTHDNDDIWNEGDINIKNIYSIFTTILLFRRFSLIKIIRLIWLTIHKKWPI